MNKFSISTSTGVSIATAKYEKKEHIKYFQDKTMEWWKHTKIEKLISECELKLFKQDSKNQLKLQKNQTRNWKGQVKKALTFVDNANDIDGKHDITTDIINKMKEKHPTKTICHN